MCGVETTRMIMLRSLNRACTPRCVFSDELPHELKTKTELMRPSIESATFVFIFATALCVVCTPQTCEVGTRCPFVQGLHTLDVDLQLCQKAFGIPPDQVREQIRLTNLYYGGDRPRWVYWYIAVKGNAVSAARCRHNVAIAVAKAFSFWSPARVRAVVHIFLACFCDE